MQRKKKKKKQKDQNALYVIASMYSRRCESYRMYLVGDSTHQTFWVFQNQRGFCKIFGMGFAFFYLKTSCIRFHLHYNNVSCILKCVFTLLQTYVLVGLDWVELMMQLPLHVTFSCIPMHTYFIFNTF